jgi:hypothetical protein
VKSVAAAVLLFVSVASAQSVGAITGTITDPDGSVVAGVAVQAKNTTSGAMFTATSLARGEFASPQLPAGAYELSVPIVGFRFARYVQQNAAVVAGQSLRLDIRLEWFDLGTVGDDTFLTLHNKYAGLTGPAPRTPDGKPDFSGMWNGNRDPNPETPATMPWVEAVMKERRGNAFRDTPTSYCLPGSPFPASPLLYKVIQTPALLVFLFEDDPHYRQVFLDGRAHPKDPDPTWLGHSVGKWESDTLVIDSVGFNDRTWLPDGLPHTDKLRVTERFRRPDLAHLQVDVTMEDPGTLTKPWLYHMVWELAPGEEMLEYICTENNQYRGGAR